MGFSPGLKNQRTSIVLVASWLVSHSNKLIYERKPRSPGLEFAFTGIVHRCSRLNRLRPSGAGDPLTGTLHCLFGGKTTFSTISCNAVIQFPAND
jgi:hypothetical protein